MNKNNINITVYPKIWNNNLFNKNQNLYDNRCLLSNNENTILEDIINDKISDFEQDIVVYSGVKKRKFIYEIFKKTY